MLIGITGLMGSGKTTLCNLLLQKDNSITYIDVDKFRHDLFNNKDYINELSNNLNKEIITYKDLNYIIYNNNNCMNIYKNILYKYLFNYLNKISEKLVIVEWALIIQDNLIEKFDKLIIVNTSIDDILKRNTFNDLSTDDVKLRLNLQLRNYNIKNINISYTIHKNIDDTYKFIMK